MRLALPSWAACQRHSRTTRMSLLLLWGEGRVNHLSSGCLGGGCIRRVELAAEGGAEAGVAREESDDSEERDDREVWDAGGASEGEAGDGVPERDRAVVVVAAAGNAEGRGPDRVEPRPTEGAVGDGAFRASREDDAPSGE